jgi:DNA phosphorothioation-dependent restriction protein DptG
MKFRRFLFASVITMLAAPASSQVYTGTGNIPLDYGTSTYTSRDDWRAQRNDWRKDSINDWRNHRNDWHEDYAKGNERKDFPKKPRADQDCAVLGQAPNTLAQGKNSTYSSNSLDESCR